MSYYFYYLYECTNLIISDIGTDVIKQQYGEDYKEAMKLFYHIGGILTDNKMYYDFFIGLREKAKDEEIKNERFQKYRKSMTRLQLLNPFLYSLFLLLIKNPPYRDIDIPKEAFMAEELKKYVPFKLTGDTDGTGETEDGST